MDIQLPEASGLEIAERLKADEELRDIPVVAVTAFAMPGDEEKIRKTGCEGYLTKPISIDGSYEPSNAISWQNMRKHPPRTAAGR